MSLALTVLLLHVATAADPGATIDDNGTITVTARRISDLAAAAEACAKTLCPTRQDVAVSVAYASALFDDGRYLEAKRLLAAAVGRVKAAALAEPMAVSQIYNAQASLAAHEGDQTILATATWAGFTTLRDGLGGDTLPSLTAEYRLALWQARVGDAKGAESRFAALTRRAAAAGHGQLADAALLKRAQVLAAQGRRSDAFALLDDLAARPIELAPDGAEVRRAALATATRLAADVGETWRSDGYFARIGAAPAATTPQLLSQPPAPKPGRGDPANPFGPETIGIDRFGQSANLVGLRWVDIGYWIRPDGRVDDVTILRGAKQLGWATPLLGWLGQRRYTPVAGDVGRAVAQVRIGDPRARWGSCASGGRIAYSWRLILAPPSVRRAVVAHEVAHLVHANHGPDFHALLGQLDPTVAASRVWLKRHGAALHWVGREG